MNRLDELIKEYCPEGVDYRPLWELTIWDKKFNTVDRYKQSNVIKYTYYLAADLKKLESSSGDVKILTTSISNLWTDEKMVGDTMSEGEIVCIPWGGNPIVQYYCGKFVTGDNRIATSADTKVLNNKYLYYCMKNKISDISSFYRGSGIKHPDMAKVLDLVIPVPPLPVQEEIVRILDVFTEVTKKFIEGLNEERAAREKQYGYYRDSLLNVAGKEYTLEDVCLIVDCPHSSPKWKESGVPVIRNFNLVNGQINTTNLSYVDEEEYRSRVKRIVPMENDILFSREAPIGNVGIIPKNFVCCQGQRVVLLRPDANIVAPRFLTYILQGGFVRDQIYRVEKIGSTVSNFNISDLKKLRFVVPTIDKQKDIIEKLDVLSQLSEDIIDRLAAEASARQKQYEYYCNKLLMFPERQVAL